MALTLLGNTYIGGNYVEEKTAVKLSRGTRQVLKGGVPKSQITDLSYEIYATE